MSSAPPATSAPPPTLAPILWVVFIGTLGFSLVLPFLVFLVLDFGGNAVMYGVTGAAYSACQLVGAPLMGRWSDRFGRRRILLLTQLGTLSAWGLFLVALLAPLVPLADVDLPALGRFTLTIPLLLLLGARALDGLTGGNVSVANAYVADITAEADRSRSFGRLAVAQNLGFVVGPAAAGVLGATALGPILPVLGALAISALALIVIALRLPETRPCAYTDTARRRSVVKLLGQEPRDCHEVQGAGRLGLRAVLALPGVGLLLGMHFLVYLGFNFFYVAFPVHAATGIGWTMRGVGLYLSGLSALMVLVQGPLLGRIGPRVPDRWLVGVGGLLLAASFLTFTGEHVALLVAGAALLALGNGLMWPALLSLLSKAAGRDAQGSVQGIAGGSSAVASILGLLVGGVFYAALGTTVFVLATAIIALAWAGSWLLPGQDLKGEGRREKGEGISPGV